VKLVGLSKIASTSDFKSDVQQLGRTMEYLASELPLKAKLDLKAYDPSLNFLLKWMQSGEEPPTMHEVLRHPFFMTPAERLTFGIALGGGSKLGMIGSYLCDNPHDAKSADVDDAFFEAVNQELTEYLETQLRLMFEGTSAAAAAAAAATLTTAATTATAAATTTAAAAGGGGCATLYVGNLNFDSSKDYLERELAQFFSLCVPTYFLSC
jgi:hypothetical protein